MIPFCGIDKCCVDANGRIKLNPRVLKDFQDHGGSEIVLHYLPEGALGLYPESTFQTMRKCARPDAAALAGESMLFRRSLRASAAMTQSVAISPQGRITIPAMFRDLAGLNNSDEVVVVGAEIGVEIWLASRWTKEQELLQDHLLAKGEKELEADLSRQTIAEGGPL